MKESLLVDTDILVDYLRGYSPAVDFFKQSVNQIHLSAITHAEIWAGVRQDEVNVVQQVLSALPVVVINATIARHAGEIQRQQSSKTGMGLADALIAACAHSIDAKLVSLNQKHFKEIENFYTPYTKKS